MRGVLVDNSTLTSVQRLLGEIPIKNKRLIDSDILALENMIQMILFYDKIFFVNDYKTQFQRSRKDYFHFLHPIEKEDIQYNEIISQAQKFTADMIPVFSNGKISDENFAPFFNLLKMNVTFTWDMSSSVYYLTQKLLADVSGQEIDKYSALSAMIYDQLSEKKEVQSTFSTPSMKIYDSNGRLVGEENTLVDKEGRQVDGMMNKQVKAFFAGLNWLALRTVTYTLMAKELGCDLFLHHIRDAFHVNMLARLQKDDTSVLRQIIDAMGNSADQGLNSVLEHTQPYVTKFNTPMFSVWIASKVDNPANYFEYAYQLRNEKIFQQARSTLKELDNANQMNHGKFVKEANKIIKDVSNQMDRIKVNYGVETPQGVPITPIIGLYNASTLVTSMPKIPSARMKIKQLDFLRDLIPKKGFNAVYRSVVNDLVQVSRIGKYHEMISSNIVLDKFATNYTIKEELKMFERFKSSWKLPL
ncbi:hypothetical protein [Bacillus safensis]|uniref:hypothetical protein n=1 Tax=Bacillus safensis TaxID=561879 RepID=UPI00201D97BB|nr:hypothetical protein [Bacillus safensis]UQZ91956.1 hypothetical protein EI692_02820 [Bacillus safensis]